MLVHDCYIFLMDHTLYFTIWVLVTNDLSFKYYILISVALQCLNESTPFIHSTQETHLVANASSPFQDSFAFCLPIYQWLTHH